MSEVQKFSMQVRDDTQFSFIFSDQTSKMGGGRVRKPISAGPALFCLQTQKGLTN